MRRLDLSGTYVPLQGLNGALGVIPGLGQILAGPNGEGVLGMKFAVRGPMDQPEVLVNPTIDDGARDLPGNFPDFQSVARSDAETGRIGAGGANDRRGERTQLGASRFRCEIEAQFTQADYSPGISRT